MCEVTDGAALLAGGGPGSLAARSVTGTRRGALPALGSDRAIFFVGRSGRPYRNAPVVFWRMGQMSSERRPLPRPRPRPRPAPGRSFC